MSERFFSNGIKDRNIIQKLRDRNGNICIYCGKELPSKIVSNGINIDGANIEHIIPQAVFKWTYEYFKEDIEDMKKCCNSLDNLALVHFDCNYIKNSNIMIEQDIYNLHAYNNIKIIYKNNLKINRRYIQKYKEIKKEIIKRQNNKCYCCGYNLDIQYATLRRIDIDKPRISENAVALCKICNKSFHKMRIGK